VAIQLVLYVGVSPQGELRSFAVSGGALVDITNLTGTISVTNPIESMDSAVSIRASASGGGVSVETSEWGLKVRVPAGGAEKRVDLEVTAPAGLRLRLETREGQISVSGLFLDVEAKSDTGTIYADTEFSNLKYKFLWTASYPRFVTDVLVEPVKEKAAGKHVIEGFAAAVSKEPADSAETETADGDTPARTLFFRTARGIILLNVPPSQVPNDLLPKKMTVAARAIYQSGDSVLATAVMRSAPDLFRDIESFDSNRGKPVLSKPGRNYEVNADIKRITVQVTDLNNRAFGDLSKSDFVISERGVEREIVDIEQATAPFNLLLILDVSGSVENHVDFIRKAARAFVNTVDVNDRVSIVTFNDDVKNLSGFSADKDALSDSLDSFDAGGGTALYDAIGYGLTDILKPLKGERAAIVILSDGDDNRSFLSFNSLLGAIEESGALIYPMYVPSSLIAASGDYSEESSVDPLRDRYLTNNLSSKAGEEGEALAKISGGVYFPISRLSELQKAYDDIVRQLRTAYTITFRSGEPIITGERASPKLKVAVKKKNAFVKLGPVTEASLK